MSKAEELADKLELEWRNNALDYDTALDSAIELRRLDAENEALKADAERYRWLRGRYLRVYSADDTGGVAFDIECQDIAINSESDGAALDAAIDSAIKENHRG